jgi:hypothetical protein
MVIDVNANRTLLLQYNNVEIFGNFNKLESIFTECKKKAENAK